VKTYEVEVVCTEVRGYTYEVKALNKAVAAEKALRYEGKLIHEKRYSTIDETVDNKSIKEV